MEDKRKKKVVIMGGNRLACLCLDEVLKRPDIEVLAVIARYDDRGNVANQEAWNASLLRMALQKGLPVFQPQSPGDELFIHSLKINPSVDVLLCMDYDQEINQAILQLPRTGAYNIHIGFTPFNPVGVSITQAILEGRPARVALYRMSPTKLIDEILETKDIPVTVEDTALSVYEKATEAGFLLFKKYLPQVLNSKTLPTKHREKAAYAWSDYLLNRRIDWAQSATEIERLVRALTLPPHPSARTFCQNVELEVLNPVKVLREPWMSKRKPGEIAKITEKGFAVKTGKGMILIKNVRLGGEVVLNGKEFCQRFNLKVGMTLGSN